MDSNPWIQKKCVPCEGGVPVLAPDQVKGYLKDLVGWNSDQDSKSISVEYRMKDFVAAIDLIQKIAQLAEEEQHHPDLHLTGYRNLRIDLSTHAIGGLSDNDFIVASKIDTLPKALKE